MLKCQPRHITNKRCARINRGRTGKILGCQGYVQRIITLPGGTLINCRYDRLPAEQKSLPDPVLGRNV